MDDNFDSNLFRWCFRTVDNATIDPVSVSVCHYLGRVAELATKMPYRACEEAISILTPLKISFNTIRNLVLKTDKLISNYKEYHEQLEDEKTEQEELLSNKQKRKVPILYLEGDGLDLFMQDRNFPRKTLHRYLVHEGT